MIHSQKLISRRSALKVIGVTTVCSMLCMSGFFNSSCYRNRRRIIFYFTGTGNSLHVARELSDKDTVLLSIPQIMKNKCFDFEADEIGFIMPTYRCAPPEMVKKFLAQVHLKAQYTFAILTYGMNHGNAVEMLDIPAKKYGVRLDYINTYQTVDNYLLAFDMNEQIRMDKNEAGQLANIKADLQKHKHWHQPVTQEEREGRAKFVKMRGEIFPIASEDYFVVSDQCIECGICTYVCPRGNWKLGQEKSEVSGDCEFCFACIQNCPQKAILFPDKKENHLIMGGEKNPNARYRNENISLADLKNANNQL